MSQTVQPQVQKSGRMNVEDALNTDVWDVDNAPHIQVDTDKCAQCKARPCLQVCPARAFALLDNRVMYSYEGCLECGTCRIMCPEKAISWKYPLSGRGVQYRF